MSSMNTEMYDALIAAGAPDDKARAAAIIVSEERLATRRDVKESEAATQLRLKAIERKIAEIEREIQEMKAATQLQMKEIQREVQEMNAATQLRLKEIEREVQEIKAATQLQIKDLERKIAELAQQIQTVENRVTATILKWNIGFMTAYTAIILAAVKL